MNRFRSGLVPLFAVVALGSCSSEPTGDLRNGIDALVATPTQLFIELGRTKTVEVGAVDAQGNPLDFNYEVTATGAGITVRRDSSFLPIFVNDTTLQAPAVGPRFRFIVEGTGYTATNFTVSAGGEEIRIPVQVVPQLGLAATFSNAAPVLGEAVTLTAPAGITFNPDATLAIGETAVTIVSQDASSITFIPPPSVNSPVTVNGVVSASAPDVVFSPATDTPLVTPLIDTVDVVYSTTTPTLGQTVTMTVPEPLINLVIDPLVDTLSDIVFPGQLPGREPGPQNIVVAPDSSSVNFDTPPNADGNATVVNFAFPGGYLIALPTRPTLTAPNVGIDIPATFSTQTPALLAPVTLTAPAGFAFAPDVAITIGGQLAVIQSVAGDGSSATFIPIPGSAGVASVDGVIPTGAPATTRVTMNTVETVTVPGITPLEGTETPETAPALTVPTAGNSTVLNDAGSFDGEPTDCCFGFHPRIYELVIAAPTTLSFNLDWFQGQDLGAYITTDDLVTVVGAADAAGEGPTGHPESTTIAFAPGTYYVNIVNFSAAPPSFFQLTISNP
jgi:hypothetical protein